MNREIELARKLLESKGYDVSKINESSSPSPTDQLLRRKGYNGIMKDLENYMSADEVKDLWRRKGYKGLIAKHRELTSNDSAEMNESALDQFKKLLHSANDITLDSLKKIGMDLDIDTDELPTEEEAQKILDIYNGKDQAENHVSPARNADSSREEKLAYARELLKRAKYNTSADDAMNAAWELVDFLHDTMLLEK